MCSLTAKSIPSCSLPTSIPPPFLPTFVPSPLLLPSCPGFPVPECTARMLLMADSFGETLVPPAKQSNGLLILCRTDSHNLIQLFPIILSHLPWNVSDISDLPGTCSKVHANKQSMLTYWPDLWGLTVVLQELQMHPKHFHNFLVAKLVAASKLSISSNGNMSAVISDSLKNS